MAREVAEYGKEKTRMGCKISSGRRLIEGRGIICTRYQGRKGRIQLGPAISNHCIP